MSLRREGWQRDGATEGQDEGADADGGNDYVGETESEEGDTIMNEIEDAKRRLYALLLAKDVNAVTDNEADLMFALAKEPGIQRLLLGRHDPVPVEVGSTLHTMPALMCSKCGRLFDVDAANSDEVRHGHCPENAPQKIEPERKVES